MISAFPGNHRVRHVGSFQELVATPFADGINALCWPRTLPGDFGEVVRLLGGGEGRVAEDRGRGIGDGGLRTEVGGQMADDSGITVLDDAQLRGLKLGAEGKVAVDFMLEDLRLLRELGRDPVLNCIHDYPRDEAPGPVATDVFSFHADSAPVEADTWLCTYHGPASEGLRNEETLRKVDMPETRAALLKLFGGVDDEAFHAFLQEHCYDLHYAPIPGARPWSFGVGNLWRIAVEWPGSAVPPCVHRAPATVAGHAPRLLLIC